MIEDDGTGFEPETIGESGFGLVGMRERSRCSTAR